MAFSQYRVDNLPNPKQQGLHEFVGNPDGILRGQTVAAINAMALEIEQQSTAEVAVVVIRDFDGDDDFEFALQVFSTWGVGKQENDNGLLLLVATDRQVYRFITGYGMEAVLPDALLKRIGENHLVPHFRGGNYDEGVLAAMETIRDVLGSPEGAEVLRAELRKQSFFYRYMDVLISVLVVVLVTFSMLKWIGYGARKQVAKSKRRKKLGQNGLSVMGGCGCVMFILFLGIFVLWFSGMTPEAIFQMKLVPWYAASAACVAIFIKYTKGEEYIRKAYRDEKNRLAALAAYHRQMIVPILLSPFALISVFTFLRRRKTMEARFVPPDESGSWTRLDRDKLKKKTELLNAGQLAEERLLSRSYELWEHGQTGEVKAVGWPGIRTKNFSACPACHYRTFKKPFIKTVTAATYQSAGSGERLQACENCSHEVSLGTVVIPRKTRSSSSGRGSSGGRSGGGGGSFGGGRSGGGGAGGRW